MKTLSEFLAENPPNERHVYLSGRLTDSLLFQTIFPKDGEGHQPLVLLSNGESLNVECDKNGHFFEYEGRRHRFLNGPKLDFKGGIVNAPSLDAARMVAEQKEINPKDLYIRIGSFLDEFYEFYCEEEKRIVIAHIIHSYLIGAIGNTFYLFLEGEMGTGKSSLQKLMALLQYNGCFTGQTTIPVLARKVHHYQATVNIDEFDKLPDEGRRATIAMLNGGAYAGGTYEYTDMNAKGSGDQIKIIQTFCAKTFSANKTRLDPSFESRCLAIHTVRSHRRTKNINAMTEEDRERVRVLRDEIFAYTLLNGMAILKKSSEEAERLEGLGYFARQADIFSIILGIEKEFEQDDKVLEYLMEKKEVEEQESKETDRVYIMWKFLVGKLRISGTATTHVEFTNQELLDDMNDALGYEREEEPLGFSTAKFKATASSIGKMLILYRVVHKKEDRQRATSGQGKGRFQYKVEKKRLLDLLSRCSYKDLVDEAQSVKEYFELGNEETPLPF